MKHALLLSGAPRCGKTTLLQTMLAQYPGPAGGFFTREVCRNGQRIAFEMVTLDGVQAILAGVHLSGPPRVGKYGVDLHALETVAVPAIRAAAQAGQLVVIDEIGPMETGSPLFCQTVLETLTTGCLLFGTIVLRSTPFSDNIKQLSGVELISVTPENRGQLLQELPDKLQKMAVGEL